MAGGASGQEPKREDVEALLETRRELGPEYDDALLESFVDRVERAVADRAGSATPAPQPPPRVDTGAGARQLALGLASLVALVPLTAIAQNESGDRLLMVFVVVVLINLVHALQSRPRRWRTPRRRLERVSVRRVMGTETEFGITVQGHPHANPMVASTRLVNAYAGSTLRARRARWDFEEESPLRDARGFDMSREVADPTQLTDEDLGLANVILTNGARLYVDHAHPEYSTPECTTPLDVVRWDKAGDQVALDAARFASVTGPGAEVGEAGGDLVLYKNNTDGKGASYGAHENYLLRRSTPFGDVVRHLTPFFVSRQVICGAGRVGIGQDGRGHGFQLSQRADFFEVEVGLETTLKRPIINTRDEPHADPEKYRRLHVIIGDANLAEVSTYLKVGTTSLVLAMIEDGWLTEDWRVTGSVASLRAVSHDPTLQHLLEVGDGRRMTAVQLQWLYLEAAQRFVVRRQGGPDLETAELLARWESVLTRLERDPMECATEIDWVAKLRLMESYRARDRLAWSDAKLALIDLQYADLRPEKGLYHRLLRAGRMERLVTDEQVGAAMTEPPSDTRAYFRGQCLARYPESIAAASWDSVIFDLPGHESLQRVPTIDPLRGSRAHVGALLDQHDTALGLFEALTRG